MKITKIEKSKHKQERVLVYLEGGDLLRITEHELLQFGITVGMDLSAEAVVQLEKAGAHSQMRATAARMASNRMLSRRELHQRLVKKGAEEAEAAQTVEWLDGLGALDDKAYAGVLARHYGGMGYGALRVQQELQRRGIPRELWDEALSQLPPPQEAIERFLQGKLKGKVPDPKETRRLADTLVRRGFRWSDIRPVLSRLGEEIEE